LSLTFFLRKKISSRCRSSIDAKVSLSACLTSVKTPVLDVFDRGLVPLILKIDYQGLLPVESDRIVAIVVP
jgi:hypothetical protein